jgi:hypothetical protein
MNRDEKTIARILFENKIFKANGQAFENLFAEIMTYAEPNFRKIKAWGNIGDKYSDGYIKEKGVYFQVYGPEDIRSSYPYVVKKINIDFKGLLKHWSPVNEFYFVVNDKFNGVNADAEQTLTALKNKYNLKKSGFFTADDLSKIVFSLDDDIIQKIIGFLPNPENLSNLEYSSLKEVIGHIMKQSLPIKAEEIKRPDWDEKIKFNKLSSHSAELLNLGSINLGGLEKYLANQTPLAQELQEQMTGIYEKIKADWEGLEYKSDNIFWEIINTCVPQNESRYQMPVLTIMSKYFESCDIFEEPKED